MNTITGYRKYVNEFTVTQLSYSMYNMYFSVDTPTRTPPEREIVCVNLKKDPKLGFGEFIKADLAVNLM